MKKFLFSVVFVFYMIMCVSMVSAATAKLSGDVEKNVKTGTVISGKTISIQMSGNEISHFKDSITITLDGADWEGYSASGDINSVISYEKSESNVIKLKINTNEAMEKEGYTAEIPLNCRITRVKGNNAAIINYGFGDVAESKVGFATGVVSGASTGTVRQVAVGDKFYQKNTNANAYSTLVIFVSPNDAEKAARSLVNVDLVGFRLTDYKDSGKLSCSGGTNAYFAKYADSTGITISFDTCSLEMKQKGFYIHMPLTGTVTGEGDIKAIIHFGDSGADDAEIVFARTNNGAVTLQAENPNSPIDNVGSISSVVISDNIKTGYAAQKTITLSLNQVFGFVGVPKIECTGKFENKCSISVDKNDSQKAVIKFTAAIPANEEGTIKILNPSVERSANASAAFQNVEMTVTSDLWKDTSFVTPVAVYKEGANSLAPLQLKCSAVASAKKYSSDVNFSITDSKREYKAGSKILLSFDNGYTVFSQGKLPSVKGTGGFENNCQIVIENGNAYIVIPKAVLGDGTISVNGIVLERESEESFDGNVKMTAVVEGDNSSSSYVDVAKYSSLYDTVPQTTTVESSTEVTTENSENVVKFVIGDKTYSINGEENELLAAPYIKDGYTMLPMRAIANIVGITNDNISFENGTAVFKIAGGLELKVTVGSNEYTVGGQSVAISTSAEIVNGTMFLPMRDLANAIGIDNDNISFDGEKKEVSLKVL